MPGTVYQLADGLQAPYTLQGVFSVERQLPRNLTIAASYINIRTLHVLRTRPLNAPLPGTFIPGVPDERHSAVGLRGFYSAGHQSFDALQYLRI